MRVYHLIEPIASILGHVLGYLTIARAAVVTPGGRHRSDRTSSDTADGPLPGRGEPSDG